MVILDTNAVIGYLAQDAKLTKAIDTYGKQGEEIALATVAVVEVLSYPALTEHELDLIERFLSKARLLDLTPAIARHAAATRRDFKLTTADAIIAATTSYYRASLITRDRALLKVPLLKVIAV